VASNVLFGHLATVLVEPWWAGLLLAPLALGLVDAMWVMRRATDPRRASSLAMTLWAFACFAGMAGLLAARASLANPPVGGVALYGAAVFASVALPERGWPRSASARAIWIVVALMTVLLTHLGLTVPGLGGGGET
jgi:hypothetical protein